MSQSSWYKVLASLLAAACVALVVVAIFNGGPSTWQDSSWTDIEDMSLSSLLWPDTQTGQGSGVMKRYACVQCGSRMDWGSNACSLCGWRRGGMLNQAAWGVAATGNLVAGREMNAAPVLTPRAIAWPVPTGQTAFTGAPAASAALLPSPRAQDAAGKEFFEGHWLGLEVITLIPTLAKLYKVPAGETGVLVDEITLESAESGILAGDLIQSIDGRPTSDLRAFFLATQHVQENARAHVGVSRRGNRMTFVVEARNTKILGFAQMEAAQPIQPGAISPHRSRGRPCTDCHVIMQSGGQLPTDAGDILPNPPPIPRNAMCPHPDRGVCSACHVIIK